MFLSIFLVLLLVVIMLLLLMPLIIVLDTDAQQYYLKIPGLVKASVVEDEKELIKVRFKVFFFTFHLYPLRPKKKRTEKKAVTKKVKKSKTRFGIRKGIRMLRSFKVKKLLLDIDTGNYVSNAQLYPIFYFLKYTTRGDFMINFEGRTRMAIYMQNRPIYLIKSFINF